MFGARTLRIRSSMLASALAVASVAAAVAAQTGGTSPAAAAKSDRLPLAIDRAACQAESCVEGVKLDCPTGCDGTTPAFFTEIEVDRGAHTTTLTRVPLQD